jgi:hypothetical protein
MQKKRRRKSHAWAPLSCANTFGAAILITLIGKARRTVLKNPHIFGINAVNAPCFTYQRGKYAPLCLLHRAQRSANHFSSRIYCIQCHYCLRYVTRSALPIFPELAYKLGSTDQKWKYGKNI